MNDKGEEIHSTIFNKLNAIKADYTKKSFKSNFFQAICTSLHHFNLKKEFNHWVEYIDDDKIKEQLSQLIFIETPEETLAKIQQVKLAEKNAKAPKGSKEKSTKWNSKKSKELLSAYYEEELIEEQLDAVEEQVEEEEKEGQ